MGTLRSLVRRNQLMSFFLLTFALCFGVGAILNGNPILAPNANFVAGVLIAALTVVGLADGRAGLKDLGRRMLRWRVPPVWYAVAFLMPIVIVGTVLVAIPLLGGTPLDWTKLPSLGEVAFFFTLFMVLPVGAPVAEEIGWRGLALPRLLANHSALVASLLLGVVWSVWHLPVVLSDPVLRVPVPFMLAILPLSILTTWIFVHTRSSLFIAILFHAWFDVVLMSGFATVAPTDAALIWWLLLGIETVLATIVVAIFGPDLVRGHAKHEREQSPAVVAA